MHQPDLFDSSQEFYFISQLEKMDTSFGKQIRKIFWRLHETEGEIMNLKDVVKKLTTEKNGES